MQIDLHIHTNLYSGCSNIDPDRLIERAISVGLDGIGITEHGIRWPDAEINELITNAGEKKLLVFPGQEIACYSKSGHFQGEFLVFGFPKSLGSNRSANELIEIVHQNKGIVIAAHPFKKAIHGEGFYGCGHSIYKWDIDGLEIEHPSYDDESRRLASEAMEKMNIAGIGCSDAHDLHHVGLFRTCFENPVSEMKDLCREIIARRAVPVKTKGNS